METKKGRVLCVDDEPNILRSLQWLLRKDFEVYTASSGQDGLDLIAQHEFDAVVSDQRMPGMMGSEFLREVRERSPRTMRMLLTGYSDLPAILRSVNDGEVFRFINKPWKTDDLLKVVTDAVAISQLPVDTQPVPPVPETDEQAEVLLVIDDQPDALDEILKDADQQFKIVHAKNIAEAVAVFDEQKVGIILSDTQVGNTDTTRMLKVLKQEHPEIVTVVYTANADADNVITLINQGQIFRFILKPVKPVTLMLAVSAATVKRKQLMSNPDLTRRHVVDSLSDESREALANELEQVAPSYSEASTPSGFLSRVAGGFWKILRRKPKE